MLGNGEAGEITRTPEPGMLKLIVFAPVVNDSLASRIACRNDPAPESFVFVTTNVCGGISVPTGVHAENSEVLPAASVAVAVTTPRGVVPVIVTLNAALPDASVVTAA